MALLFLLYPFLELFTMYRVGSEIGVANTLFWFLAAGVLGFGILRAQGRFFLRGFQSSLARGEIPANQALHSALIFFGGIAIAVPGFLSDAVGLLFVLPGTRHLIAMYLKVMLAKKISTGAFRVFTMGNMGGFGAASHGNPFEPRASSPRDVTPKGLHEGTGGDVIDVDFTSTSSASSSKTDDPKGGGSN